MFKVKQNNAQEQQFLSQMPDSFSLTIKNSSRNSFSRNEMQFPICSRKILSKKMSSMQFNQKIQFSQVTCKKQEYFQTQNQMVVHEKKQLPCFANNYHFKSSESRGYLNTKTKKICRQFSSKLRRNLIPKNIEQIQKVLQEINEGKIKSKQLSNLQRLSDILNTIWKILLILEFLICTLSFAFSHLSQRLSFLFLHLISCLLFAHKQTAKYLLKGNFNLKKYIKQLTVHKFLFLVNILTIILWFNSMYTYISFVNILFGLLYFQMIEMSKCLIISLAFCRKVWFLFEHFIIVKIMLKMLFWTYIVSIILNKLYWSNITENWLARSLDISSTNHHQVFVLCFTQSISIIFSFGLYMPSSTNTNESIMFSIVRVVTFLLNLTNLQELFNHCFCMHSRNKSAESYKMLVFKDILKATSLNNKHYCQISDEMENIIYQNRHRSTQSEYEDVLQSLSKRTRDKVLGHKYKEQIILFTKIFPFMIQKTKIQLGQCLKLQIYSKHQIVKEFSKSHDFFILKEGQLAYISSSRSSYVTRLQCTRQGQLMLLNNSFITKKFPNYHLKCLGFAKILRIQEQTFRKIISQSQSDFQYFWITCHSASLYTEQWSFTQCKICRLKHSEFECPKIHYIPFRSQIVWKYLLKKHNFFKQHIIYKQYRIPRLKISALKFYIINRNSNLNKQHILKLDHQRGNYNSENFRPQNLGRMLEQMKERIYQKHREQDVEQDQVWGIKSDILHDYNYYFKAYNPNNLRKCIIGELQDFL